MANPSRLLARPSKLPADGPRLVAQIRGNLAALPEDQRLSVMTQFLDIGYHYRAQHNPDNPPEVPSQHEAAFLSLIQGFRAMARRQQAEFHNSAYMTLCSEIRALAGVGPSDPIPRDT